MTNPLLKIEIDKDEQTYQTGITNKVAISFYNYNFHLKISIYCKFFNYIYCSSIGQYNHAIMYYHSI